MKVFYFYIALINLLDLLGIIAAISETMIILPEKKDLSVPAILRKITDGKRKGLAASRNQAILFSKAVLIKSAVLRNATAGKIEKLIERRSRFFTGGKARDKQLNSSLTWCLNTGA